MRCVLVIRPDGPFSARLRGAGFEVLNLDLIRAEPVEDLSDLDEKIERIGEYDGLFFTSPRAAEIFLLRIKKLGRHFAGKIYVLGERARKVFEGSGFDVVSVPSANTAEEMLASFDPVEFAGKKFLFVRGENSMRTIPERLDRIAEIGEAAVYRTVEILPDREVVADIKDRLARGWIDWICFFSPSGVEAFTKLFAADGFVTFRAAAIGETTARKAGAAGLNVGFVAQRSTAEDFASGLIGLLQKA